MPKKKSTTKQARRSAPTETLRARFSKRLRGALVSRGYPVEIPKMAARLATTYGVSLSAARKWVAGENMPDYENLVRLSRSLGIPIDTMLTGDQKAFQLLRLAESLVFLPRSARAQLGAGLPVRSIMAISPGWLADVLGVTNPDSVDIHVAAGDTMDPVLKAGEVAIYRRNVTAFEDNAIYVLRQDDMTKVRRVSSTSNRQVRCICQNKNYPPETLPISQVAFGEEASGAKVCVLGLVVGRIKFA